MDKEEINDKLNELLGTSNNPIDFTKLSKKDMERLLSIFSNALQLMQLGVRTVRNKVQQGRFLLKPVREVAEMRVLDVVRAVRKEGGLLGLLDELMRASVERKEE